MVVYPRWRGELSWEDEEIIQSVGLSPLARGTHNNQYQLVFPTRFIPAGAGNSQAWARTAICTSVYPRWRGELSGS